MKLSSLRLALHAVVPGILTLTGSALAADPGASAGADMPAASVDEFGEPDAPAEGAAAPAATAPAGPVAEPAPAASAAASPPVATARPDDELAIAEEDRPVRRRRERGTREASTGFQGALRLGFMFPGGRATGEDRDLLSSRYSWQLPITLDLGVKPSPHVFVGTYMGFSKGAEGNDTRIEGYCDDDDEDFENDISCDSYTLRIGLQAQYHALPDQRWNPWIGYGFGYILANQSIEDRERSRSEDTTVTGLTYAQISGGIDFRSALGVGPYGEVSIGRFNSTHTVIDNEDTFQGAIDERAIHYWLTIGVRLVVRP